DEGNQLEEDASHTATPSRCHRGRYDARPLVSPDSLEEGGIALERVAQRQSVSAAWMRHHVYRRRRRQDDHIILARLDLDAIAIGHPEPLLRHLGDLMAAHLKGILMIDNVALNIHVRAVANLDGPAVAD